MFYLQILSGKAAGTMTTARRLPFCVGRQAEADLRSEEPGVWEGHLHIELVEGEGIWVTARPEAPLALNGAAVQRARLRNGDVLEAGGLKLRFWLAPAPLRPLQMREALTWGMLAGLGALQVFLAWWLH